MSSELEQSRIWEVDPDLIPQEDITMEMVRICQKARRMKIVDCTSIWYEGPPFAARRAAEFPYGWTVLGHIRAEDLR